MNKQEFKKLVYDLAKFNSTLTKGYCGEWKQSDYTGYSKKHKELKKLINIAKENDYPVFFDSRTSVVYFMFGEVQISFHTGANKITAENYGLSHTPIKWDGIKNAFNYTEVEYIKLKQYRKKILQERINKFIIKKNELLDFFEKYIDGLKKKLKRARTEKTKNNIINEIDTIKNKTIYGLCEYFKYFDDAKNICKELRPMFNDSYITEFKV